MPTSTTHFSPSQVRTRLRSALRNVNGRGGGTILRVIVPNPIRPANDVLEPPFELASLLDDHINLALRVPNFVHSTVKISVALQLNSQFFCAHNRVMYILRTSGRDILKAQLLPVHLGNPTVPPVVGNLHYHFLTEEGYVNLSAIGMTDELQQRYSDSINNRSY
jgi:hypothetical protein